MAQIAAGIAPEPALKNAVEQNLAAYCTPPRTGGKQMSVRLDDFLLNHVEALAELASWNRSEALYAVAHYGILHLYQEEPEIAEKAVANIMEKFKAQYSGDLGG